MNDSKSPKKKHQPFLQTKEEKLKLKTQTPISLCETVNFSDYFLECIKEASLSALFFKCKERFENNQEIRDFIDNGELFPVESDFFHEFLLKAQNICLDLRINPMSIQGQNLVKFLSFIFKLGSLRCLYSDIRIFWSRDFKHFKSIRIMPQGIVVDLELSNFDVLIAYDNSQPNVFYSSIFNNAYHDLAKKKVDKTKESSNYQKNRNNECFFKNDEAMENIQNESFIDCISIFALSIMLFFVLSLIIFMTSYSF